MRKKPTNLTMSDDIRARAERIMARDGFSTLSSFVEHLIREEYNRLTDAGKIAAVAPVAVAPPKTVHEIKAAILDTPKPLKARRKRIGNG